MFLRREDHLESIFSSLGLHPGYAIKASKRELGNHKDMIRGIKEEIVAIDEVGLDPYHLKKRNEGKAKKCSAG
ncbi:hypothetical protein AKJ57_02460 [candidate division MSBL1 archaeon SCGC-AAA259A05]|uniref:Uncharacterized protein n=1 Tax=candidate division MSBL1 archaeon SCGC-AAA259A05 TaxID=1698259 RepID=A0A133UA63_9EURY|nr:hypothetical protein AKJ57_02460 [candidate division MSBL1 archaeon SCGC-AAA259A05]